MALTDASLLLGCWMLCQRVAFSAGGQSLLFELQIQQYRSGFLEDGLFLRMIENPLLPESLQVRIVRFDPVDERSS